MGKKQQFDVWENACFKTTITTLLSAAAANVNVEEGDRFVHGHDPHRDLVQEGQIVEAAHVGLRHLQHLQAHRLHSNNFVLVFSPLISPERRPVQCAYEASRRGSKRA